MPISPLSVARSTALAAFLCLILASSAIAQKRYDPGATDTEIKIGNIMPYSGPASAYATIGKTEAAYFNNLNAGGGINGRKSPTTTATARQRPWSRHASSSSPMRCF